jgi:tripartite-type tricarboxylate transporter receptor subunit TctC
MLTARTALFLGLVCAGAMVQAQSYPSKPIRLIVANPPGAIADQTARLVAQKASESLGQPIVVDNRPGGNGIPGVEFVAHSAPDGYTLLLGTAATHVSNLFLLKSIPYDPVKDFTPIAGGVDAVMLVAANASVPFNSIRELIDYSKRSSGKVTYGTPGGAVQLAGEEFRILSGADILHIQYKGFAQALTDALSGQISMMITSVTIAAPHVKAGKLKVIAVVDDKRYSGMPDVATIAESVSGFRKPATWNGFFGPAGLPVPLLARLNAEIVKALTAPDVRPKFEGSEILAGSPDQFAALVKSEIESFARIVKAVGIQPE